MNLVSDSEQEYKKTPCCGLRPCRNEEGFLADVGKSVGQRSGLAAKRSDSEAVLQRSGLALAFSQVCTLTGLRGRWETVREHPLTICDTGHNAHGIKYVAEQLQTLMPHFRNTRIIFGMVADKDISEVVRLLPRDAIYYFTQPDNHRAFPADELLKMFEEISSSPMKGENPKSPFKGDLEGLEGQGGSEAQVLLRISNRTITLHDTVYICRTDTLIRTQTITQKERYIPPFYRFCTITLATLATIATLTFSIHLLLRYLKIRSPIWSPPLWGHLLPAFLAKWANVAPYSPEPTIR